MRIPLSSPDITEAEIAAVSDVLGTARLSLGPKLEKFEQQLAGYVSTTHAVAVNSGTSGLHLCLRALDIAEGDEVIVPSFAFIAVANAARYVGAIPIFVDIQPESRNIDPAKIEAAITAKTRCILVVHTFGCPADLTEILEIARRHKLLVVEDACEALGGEYDGKKVGTLGDAGIFGFYPNKQITTGEGGALVTNNSETARRAKIMRNQGRAETDDWLQHVELGYNYRISEINCALGIEQLKRIEAILQARENVAREYAKRLKKNNRLILPAMRRQGCRISWFVYVVQLAETFSLEQRDAIVRQLAERGIGCGRYFAPIHMQPAYQREKHRSMELPVTESIAPRTLALPFFNKITETEIEEVCDTLQELILKV